MRTQRLTVCDFEGNPASVSQCLIASGNSSESLLSVCHRVCVGPLQLGLCVYVSVCESVSVCVSVSAIKNWFL